MTKRYEELTIADDFMFGKAMGDKVLCQDVLERLLEEKVGEPSSGGEAGTAETEQILPVYDGYRSSE